MWGCELKCECKQRYPRCRRHPPCEDVSWNGNKIGVKQGTVGHPPCEDVSWNDVIVSISNDSWSSSLWGCELKCNQDRIHGREWRSSSLWGCELKYQVHIHISVADTKSSSLWGCELKSQSSSVTLCLPASSSLWGCELKSIFFDLCNFGTCHPPCEDVSWNAKRLN